MKSRLLLLVGMLLWGFNGLFAQNLVVNPSFETELACPGVSILSSFSNWRDPWVNLVGDTCSTSDSYRVGGGIICGGLFILGNTTARTGTRVAGIITYSGFAFSGCTPILTDNWREYAEGQLTSPLVAGQTYCVSLWVKLAGSVKWATDRMGVYMSNSLVTFGCNTTGSDSHLQSKGIIPQMESTTVITNTATWTNLTFSYLATGGEQFITIGNFRNAGGTTRSNNNCSAINPYAYYYLDDISVTLGACALLPIELESFKVDCKDNQVQLAWETASGGNSQDVYTVERSTDAALWQSIGSVADEEGSMTKNYRFLDAAAFGGEEQIAVQYYRLKMIDLNGQTQYSKVLDVRNCAALENIVIYPNPSSGSATISSEDEIRGYKITDVWGKTVASDASVYARQATFDISDAPAGVYHIAVQGKAGVVDQRWVKR